MEILCPECNYSREVDETKIPAKSQVATCPKCQMKFKFRELPEEEFLMEEPAAPTLTTKPRPTPAPLRKRPAVTPEAPTFPKLTAPGEDSNDELWEKLHGMTPPAEEPEIRKSAYTDQEPVPGWTGTFSEDFPDPMADEDSAYNDDPNPLVPPPFEQLDRYGFFHGLYLTLKLVITSPRLFFSVMPVGGGLAKPLTFAILVAMVQTVAQLAWGAVGLGINFDPDNAQLVNQVPGVTSFILDLLLTPAAVAMSQFVIAGIYHGLLTVMHVDNKGFEGTFRAACYAYAPLILGIFPMPTVMVLSIWTFIYAVWGLFLAIIGLKYIHNASFSKVIPVALIPPLIAMIMILAFFQGKFPTI